MKQLAVLHMWVVRDKLAEVCRQKEQLQQRMQEYVRDDDPTKNK